MFVFTRRTDDAFMIGDGIRVSVAEIGKESVRLCVQAPNIVSVTRDEVHQSLKGGDAKYVPAGSLGELLAFETLGHEVLHFCRREGEVIRIGDCVVVTVVRIREDNARFGVEFPEPLSVHRQEVYDAIQRSKLKGLASDAALTPDGKSVKVMAIRALQSMDEDVSLDRAIELLIEFRDGLDK